MKEQMINEILEDIDFEKIRKVMLYLEWTWQGNDEPPSIYKLIQWAKEMLNSAYDNSIKGKDNCFLSSGGFTAIANYCNETKTVDYMQLYFSITEREVNLENL